MRQACCALRNAAALVPTAEAHARSAACQWACHPWCPGPCRRWLPAELCYGMPCLFDFDWTAVLLHAACRMKEGQSSIYWVAGQDMDEVKKSPFTETLVSKVGLRVKGLGLRPAPASTQRRIQQRLVQQRPASRVPECRRSPFHSALQLWWSPCCAAVLGAGLRSDLLHRCAGRVRHAAADRV